MGLEQLPYTIHAPIAIQGSRINMSNMKHEGQILHIGYGHHTGVTNNMSDMNHEGQILHIRYGHHTGVTNNIRGHEQHTGSRISLHGL